MTKKHFAILAAISIAVIFTLYVTSYLYFRQWHGYRAGYGGQVRVINLTTLTWIYEPIVLFERVVLGVGVIFQDKYKGVIM